MPAHRHPASFRDPSGYVYEENGKIFRFVHRQYAPAFDKLCSSGLYEQLTKKGWLIRHTEIATAPTEDCYKILQPELVPFWTYPYEWSFEQLRAAAIRTLEINLEALEHGMILKDANAYNIQLVQGEAQLIDSLSFDEYAEGRPWVAFYQFCEQFLYPLLFCKYAGGSPAMLLAYPDGLPVEMVKQVLPMKSRLSLNNWLYIFLPASVVKKKQKNAARKSFVIPKSRVVQNMQQLKGFIASLSLADKTSRWKDYYEATVLSQEYLEHKKQVVEQALQKARPQRVIDIGCNTGSFSTIAAAYAQQVVAMDTDASCIDRLHAAAKKQKLQNLTAIVADICQPTPRTGWANAEHSALLQRAGGDMVLALALVHHLALSKNISLDMIAALFASMTSQYLLIEFVPKEDEKAQQLLANREDIFPQYNRADFERIFKGYFQLQECWQLQGSERILYLFAK